MTEDAARIWWSFLNGRDSWMALDSAQQCVFVQEHMISDWAAEAYGAEMTDPGHCDGWECQMDAEWALPS
jgi:hypothetical protein